LFRLHSHCKIAGETPAPQPARTMAVDPDGLQIMNSWREVRMRRGV
jgi:hypothetical protein